MDSLSRAGIPEGHRRNTLSMRERKERHSIHSTTISKDDLIFPIIMRSSNCADAAESYCCNLYLRTAERPARAWLLLLASARKKDSIVTLSTER